MGLLDGKVAVVTGAGRGIGRTEALLLAAEGAAVVVNDVGGSSGGEGSDTRPAQQVVDEITAAGGRAAANYDNCATWSGGQGLIRQAIDVFDRLDILINNAGILRDRMCFTMEEAEWDAVIAVHLRGAFNVSRATIEHFRNQGSGSYVHFTSTTGLIGNLGQANYAAAKLGVCGLSRILAIEGASKNIRSNVIAPFAWTRMTSSIPITDEASAIRVGRMRDGMRSDQVAQLSIALCADGAQDVSGQIFCVRGDEVILFSQPRPVASIARADGWTPQRLLEGGLASLKPRFTDLGVSASVFPYDPI